MKNIHKLSAVSMLILLAACSHGPVPNGVKIGKPYDVGGKTYYPQYDPTYDETGLASWYGPGFHGGRTANGERFDTHDLTAAHPTLPMPSLVRVTNVENGKTLVVRINDRGPFAKDRIIDLSSAAAHELGIKGLAKVRVQYMKAESEQYLAAIQEGRNIDMVAYNRQLESEKNASIMAATAPSDQSFIIESTQNQTQPGDTVSGAAPIVSVTGADLPAKGEKKKTGGGILVRDAVADETTNEVMLKAPKPPAGPTGKFYIQVGSFSQQANAQKMQDQIAIAANIAQVEVGGHVWWRLRAGPFNTDEEAQAALVKIREHAADARIMRQ